MAAAVQSGGLILLTHTSRLLKLTTGLTAVMVTTALAGCGSSSGKASADSSPSPSASESSSSSSDSPTTADFTGVLLSADEVGSAASATFTGTDSTDDSSDTASGCAALDDFTKAAKGSEKARAGRDFETADQSTSVSEEILNAPEAESLFTTLKDALKQCSGFTIAGTTLNLVTLTDPSIDGSDATLAAEASGVVDGQAVAVDIFSARFGDNVLSITYSGVDSSDARTVAQQLLDRATTKAKDVL